MSRKMVRFVSLFLILLAFHCSIFGMQLIPIGSHCTVALALRNSNIRTRAFPFDWMFSSLDRITNTIEDDFNSFLDPDFLHLSKDRKRIINKYGLEFVHDFPTIKDKAAVNEEDFHL